MNDYHQFVREVAAALHRGKALPLGGFSRPPAPASRPGAPRVLLFSPHPDDEVIVGGLALRLLREAGMPVINVAVTQGSNPARQAGRWQELTACCAHIGFGLVQTREGGFEGVNPRQREAKPELWAANVRRTADILREHAPHTIFFPHDRDWNGTHVGTHLLLVDALRELGAGFTCFTVETEFWGAMDDPNLMVECSETDLADMLTALSFHVGEVQRNPYHLRTPGWMIDNVRRGCELVGGQGGAAPDFTFATLYRLRRWRLGNFEPVLEHGRFLSVAENAGRVFPGLA